MDSFFGKTRLYHGTTFSSLKSILSNKALGLIVKNGKKIKLKTFASMSLEAAKQYAVQRAVNNNEEFCVVLSFLVDPDQWSSSDHIIAGNTGYKFNEIKTQEPYEFVFSCPIELEYLKIHPITRCHKGARISTWTKMGYNETLFQIFNSNLGTMFTGTDAQCSEVLNIIHMIEKFKQ